MEQVVIDIDGDSATEIEVGGLGPFWCSATYQLHARIWAQIHLGLLATAKFVIALKVVPEAFLDANLH